jgi:hypothetical protein
MTSSVFVGSVFKSFSASLSNCSTHPGKPGKNRNPDSDIIDNKLTIKIIRDSYM